MPSPGNQWSFGFSAKKRKSRAVVFQALFVDAINVEGWIRHYEIELADALMDVFVIGNTLSNVATETVYSEVHCAEPDRFSDLLLAVDCDIGYCLLVVLNECR